jgi:tRNA threonylcarbamoyladenosine biosynthesis protein TsaB
MSGGLMRILALDSATGSCSATIVAGSTVLSERIRLMDRGQAAILPALVTEVLAESGIAATGLDLIAVTVGPGSFTGIRGAVALAQGLALGAGIQAVGVMNREAIAEALPGQLPDWGGRTLWVATPSRRGHVFLEQADRVDSMALTQLPGPDQPVAIAGMAAMEVACRLAARGFDVMLTDMRRPAGRHVAAVAARRARAEIPACPAEPLYIDPPAVRAPPEPASDPGA